MTRRRGESGSTLVEFALVVPILVTVMLGVLQYGYHYWALETASATAREAARRLAVGTDEACTRAEAISRLDAPGVGGSAPTMSASYQPARAAGGVVTVTVTVTSLHIPFFPLPDDGVVTQSAQARLETIPTAALAC